MPNLTPIRVTLSPNRTKDTQDHSKFEAFEFKSIEKKPQRDNNQSIEQTLIVTPSDGNSAISQNYVSFANFNTKQKPNSTPVNPETNFKQTDRQKSTNIIQSQHETEKSQLQSPNQNEPPSTSKNDTKTFQLSKIDSSRVNFNYTKIENIQKELPNMNIEFERKKDDLTFNYPRMPESLGITLNDNDLTKFQPISKDFQNSKNGEIENDKKIEKSSSNKNQIFHSRLNPIKNKNDLVDVKNETNNDDIYATEQVLNQEPFPQVSDRSSHLKLLKPQIENPIIDGNHQLTESNNVNNVFLSFGKYSDKFVPISFKNDKTSLSENPQETTPKNSITQNKNINQFYDQNPFTEPDPTINAFCNPRAQSTKIPNQINYNNPIVTSSNVSNSAEPSFAPLITSFQFFVQDIQLIFNDLIIKIHKLIEQSLINSNTKPISLQSNSLNEIVQQSKYQLADLTENLQREMFENQKTLSLKFNGMRRELNDLKISDVKICLELQRDIFFKDSKIDSLNKTLSTYKIQLDSATSNINERLIHIKKLEKSNLLILAERKKTAEISQNDSNKVSEELLEQKEKLESILKENERNLKSEKGKLDEFYEKTKSLSKNVVFLEKENELKQKKIESLVFFKKENENQIKLAKIEIEKLQMENKMLKIENQEKSNHFNQNSEHVNYQLKNALLENEIVTFKAKINDYEEKCHRLKMDFSTLKSENEMKLSGFNEYQTFKEIEIIQLKNEINRLKLVIGDNNLNEMDLTKTPNKLNSDNNVINESNDAKLQTQISAKNQPKKNADDMKIDANEQNWSEEFDSFQSGQEISYHKDNESELNLLCKQTLEKDNEQKIDYYQKMIDFLKSKYNNICLKHKFAQKELENDFNLTKNLLREEFEKEKQKTKKLENEIQFLLKENEEKTTKINNFSQKKTQFEESIKILNDELTKLDEKTKRNETQKINFEKKVNQNENNSEFKIIKNDAKIEKMKTKIENLIKQKKQILENSEIEKKLLKKQIMTLNEKINKQTNWKNQFELDSEHFEIRAREEEKDEKIRSLENQLEHLKIQLEIKNALLFEKEQVVKRFEIVLEEKSLEMKLIGENLENLKAKLSIEGKKERRGDLIVGLKEKNRINETIINELRTEIMSFKEIDEGKRNEKSKEKLGSENFKLKMELKKQKKNEKLKNETNSESKNRQMITKYLTNDDMGDQNRKDNRVRNAITDDLNNVMEEIKSDSKIKNVIAQDLTNNDLLYDISYDKKTPNFNTDDSNDKNMINEAQSESRNHKLTLEHHNNESIITKLKLKIKGLEFELNKKTLKKDELNYVKNQNEILKRELNQLYSQKIQQWETININQQKQTKEPSIKNIDKDKSFTHSLEFKQNEKFKNINRDKKLTQSNESEQNEQQKNNPILTSQQERPQSDLKDQKSLFKPNLINPNEAEEIITKLNHQNQTFEQEIKALKAQNETLKLKITDCETNYLVKIANLKEKKKFYKDKLIELNNFDRSEILNLKLINERLKNQIESQNQQTQTNLMQNRNNFGRGNYDELNEGEISQKNIEQNEVNKLKTENIENHIEQEQSRLNKKWAKMDKQSETNQLENQVMEKPTISEKSELNRITTNNDDYKKVDELKSITFHSQGPIETTKKPNLTKLYSQSDAKIYKIIKNTEKNELQLHLKNTIKNVVENPKIEYQISDKQQQNKNQKDQKISNKNMIEFQSKKSNKDNNELMKVQGQLIEAKTLENDQKQLPNPTKFEDQQTAHQKSTLNNNKILSVSNLLKAKQKTINKNQNVKSNFSQNLVDSNQQKMKKNDNIDLEKNKQNDTHYNLNQSKPKDETSDKAQTSKDKNDKFSTSKKPNDSIQMPEKNTNNIQTLNDLNENIQTFKNITNNILVSENQHEMIRSYKNSNQSSEKSNKLDSKRTDGEIFETIEKIEKINSEIKNTIESKQIHKNPIEYLYSHLDEIQPNEKKPNNSFCESEIESRTWNKNETEHHTRTENDLEKFILSIPVNEFRYQMEEKHLEECARLTQNLVQMLREYEHEFMELRDRVKNQNEENE